MQVLAKQLYNQQVEGSQQPGFSPIYRDPSFVHQLIDGRRKYKSMRDFLYAFRNRFAQDYLFGKIKPKKSEGSPQEPQFEIEYYQVKEIIQQVEFLGKFVLSNKLYEEQETRKMKFIGIYAKNRPEWIIADMACAIFGLTSIPLYQSLGAQNFIYTLNQTQLSTIYVSMQTVVNLLGLSSLQNLANIVSFDPLSQEIENQIKQRNLKLFYFSDIVAKGKEIQFDPFSVPLDSQNIFTFSYTSGTTGLSKGAMLSHGNFTTIITSFEDDPQKAFPLNTRYFSYLPLPHVMEHAIIYTMLSAGSTVIFSSGQVLKILDDIKLAKPTHLAMVPRILHRIVDGIREKVNAIYKAQGKAEVQSGDYESLRIPALYQKVRESLGGSISFCAVGGAALHHNAHLYLRQLLGCPVLQGYGLTESIAAGMGQKQNDKTTGHVGGVSVKYTQIQTALEFKLRDLPQLNYTSNDKDENGNPTPRGEIWLRGGAIFKGYYKLPEFTKEVLSQDGWLKTGDIGELIPSKENAVKIIDRVKNIFKLQQGQYIAPQKIEAVYLKHNLISEIFITGESTEAFAVAVIVPKVEEIKKLANRLNLQNDDGLWSNKGLRAAITKELFQLGKSEGLQSYEQVKNIYLEKQSFQALNLVTLTLKLQRSQGKKHFQAQVNQLYKEGILNFQKK